MTLELDMKVCDFLKYYFHLANCEQFVEFGQIEHTKVLATC
jgi:hypothetical protein